MSRKFFEISLLEIKAYALKQHAGLWLALQGQIMNIWFYDNSRQFLEKMIQENPSNAELVKAYTSLISKVADIEMKYSEHNTDYNKNHDKNQAELAKNFQTAQADITKKQIEKGALPVTFGQNLI